MRTSSRSLTLAATDLSNFLSCRYRTALDLAVSAGKKERPHFTDPLLDALFARGREHEQAYVQALSAPGRVLLDLADLRDPDEAVERTIVALRDGVDIVVQGALRIDGWYGRPDLLLKTTDLGSDGQPLYEVADTKLALETKGGTILQLVLYSEMLAEVQGALPKYFQVVTPEDGATRHAFRVRDFAAYVRLIRSRLQDAVSMGDEALAAANYPEPLDHCDVCAWASVCRQQRRQDDHLSLVAGISRIQRHELETRDVRTLAQLAALPLPLPFKPTRGAAATYERVREQARLQLQARTSGQPVAELITPIQPDTGLCRLPEPSPGDLFLDLEGDPFVGENGREYLFGLVERSKGAAGQASVEPVYQAWWAETEAKERAAFEQVMTTVMEAWAADPGFHVYHFAPYEPSALKRLASRYATREADVDSLLRGGRFVDLYHVVRQALRAGVERYSIKNFEPFYEFERQVPLTQASQALRVMELALELNRPRVVTKQVRETIRGYNEDDCRSTYRLRNWLEVQRANAIAAGHTIPRPAAKEAAASDALSAHEQRVADLRQQLLAGVPEERDQRSSDQQARWRMAYLLDWHRRESKAEWWEYYRLIELPQEDLFDEAKAIAGLQWATRVDLVQNIRTGKPTGSVIDRYVYPAQEMEVRDGDEVKLTDGSKFGDVTAVDRQSRTIDVKKSRKVADEHPFALFAHSHVPTDTLEDSIGASGEALAAGEPSPLLLRLLRGDAPQLESATFERLAGESASDFAVRIVRDLDASVLAIQGPPGAGKTYTGARMICDLVRQGKRVGVTANSHAVIRNLLDEVARQASKAGIAVSLGHKVKTAQDKLPKTDGGAVSAFIENGDALAALTTGDVNVLGGTAWLWARDDFARTVDVLFVDEAGQMSLANVVAVTPCTNAIVLLGDPQQLEQPKKGSHPDGVNDSVLQHMLGERQTIPDERGIFLPVTWRLAPAVCQFTSELFYESRLTSRPGLEQQQLTGTPFVGAGLWVVDVDHTGNRNASDEEVEAVASLIQLLVAPGSDWIDAEGVSQPLTANDILVVAPYNAHVARLTERLDGTGVRVGTVDKFQGKEAPVVIYSMATSAPEDAPRGLEFLYSLNRLNVATSRAKCAAILVASPALFTPDCSTPRQMKLANALCRYRELTRTLSLPIAAV